MELDTTAIIILSLFFLSGFCAAAGFGVIICDRIRRWHSQQIAYQRLAAEVACEAERQRYRELHERHQDGDRNHRKLIGACEDIKMLLEKELEEEYDRHGIN